MFAPTWSSDATDAIRRCARKPGLSGRLGGADGRAVVSHFAPASDGRDVSAMSKPAGHGHAGSRRLLAVRLCDSQGRDRARGGEGWSFPRASRAKCRRFSPTASSELKSWDDVKLLSVTVDRLRKWWRPGLHLHRRCGARDVADRRGGNQPRGAGRGRRREPPRRPAKQRRDNGRGSASHRASPHAAGTMEQYVTEL